MFSRGVLYPMGVGYIKGKYGLIYEEGKVAEEAVSGETLVNRLKRIEGQVRGIQKMIEDGRDCESVITQLGAVRSAIEGVGALLLRNYMKICFSRETVAECADIESLARAIAIWGRVRFGNNS